MKKDIFLALFFMLSGGALIAALPTSPLNEEYTITGNETVHGEWWQPYQVGDNGILNIYGEGAMLTVNYAYNYSPTFSCSGIVNVGSDTDFGRLVVTSTEAFEDGWNNIINFTGTINVGYLGDFSISGEYPSHYGTIFSIRNLNVDGTVSVMSSIQNNVSYFAVGNLNLSKDGMFTSEIDIQMTGNGVYNIYGNGLSAPRIRITKDDGGAGKVINLKSKDVLSGVNVIDFESNQAVSSSLRINAEADNTIKAIIFNSNSVLEISVAEGQKLLLNNLKIKDSSVSNVAIEFYDYTNGSFGIGNSDVWIEDNRLYIPSTDTYVDLIAYDAEGSVLSGIWSLYWDGYTNSFMFNQTVPEPAVFAVVLGGLALFCALRNRRRPRSR